MGFQQLLLPNFIFNLSFAILLAGCHARFSSNSSSLTLKKSLHPPQESSILRSLKKRFPPNFSKPQFLNYLQQKKWFLASNYVNRALKDHPQSMVLHLLNAYVYEILVDQGHIQFRNCIKVGYQAACNCEPLNWLPLYRIGLYCFKEKNYEKSKSYLKRAWNLNPKNPQLTYALLRSAYFSGDLVYGRQLLPHAYSLAQKDSRLWGSYAIVAAATNNFHEARQALHRYQTTKPYPSHQDVTYVENRLKAWENLYDVAKKSPKILDSATSLKNSKDPTLPEDKETPLVIFIECHLMAIISNNRKNEGNNILAPVAKDGLLQSLQMVFKGSEAREGRIPSSLGYESDRNYQLEVTQDEDGEQVINETLDTGRGSGMKIAFTTSQENDTNDGFAYLMNIWNASERYLEIKANPVVSTVLNKSVEFSSTDRLYGNVGGSSTNVDAGIKVECLPLQMDADGRLTMETTLTLSSLDPGARLSSPIDEQIIGVEKSKTSLTHTQYEGQMLVLSSMTTQTDISDKSGFPLLKNVPIFSFLFSRKILSKERRTFLCLISFRLGNKKGKNPVVPPDAQCPLSESAMEKVLKLLDQQGKIIYIQHNDFPQLYSDPNAKEKIEDLFKNFY